MPRKCRVSQLFYQLCLHDGSQCKQRFSTDLLIKLNFLDCASCCSGTRRKPAEFDANHYTVIVLKILCAQGSLSLSLFLYIYLTYRPLIVKCLLSILLPGHMFQLFWETESSQAIWSWVRGPGKE